MTMMINSGSVPAQQQDIVYALARSTGALYAARTSGLYRSIPSTGSWRKVEATPEVNSVSATAVIASGGDVFAGVNGGVLCSNDDGDHWQWVALATPAPQVTALVVSPVYADDGFIAAATAQDGVFISTDRGQHWAAWNFGLIDHAIYALAVSPHFAVDHTLFAGTESGLVRSKNGGRGWHDVLFPVDAAPVLSLVVSAAFQTDGTVYAGTEAHGLYVSRDNGSGWQPIEGLADSTINMIGLTSQPTPELWLLREDRLLHGTDDGKHWEPYLNSAEDRSVTALLASADGLTIGFADGEVETSRM